MQIATAAAKSPAIKCTPAGALSRTDSAPAFCYQHQAARNSQFISTNSISHPELEPAFTDWASGAPDDVITTWR